MNILASVIIGFAVGLIARFLMPGRDAAGFLLTTGLGILGSVLATFLGHAIGLYQTDESAGFLMSVFGALVVLFIYNKISQHGSTPRPI